MKEVQINLWNPHKNQRRIVQSKARYKVLVTGRRFGKTTTAVNVLIKHALLKENSQYFYVAPTYRQAKMIAWRMLAYQARHLPDELVSRINESELYIELTNGSRIDIKGADKPDSLRGVGLDGVVLDEYADIKPHVYDEIVAPALVDKKGFALFIGTPRGFNHFYDTYNLAQSMDEWETFHFTSYDNPHIDPDEIDKEKARISEDRFAQEYMGDFRKQEGLVYKEFDRNRHVFTNDNPVASVSEVIAGVDFGYTNPTAVLKILKNHDNTYYVISEWCKTSKTNTEVVEYAKTLGVNSFYPDPAEPARIEEMMRAGLNVREVNKDIAKGIDTVRSLFKQNKLFIHSDCTNLIWELENYSYNEKKENHNEDETPVKENDHCCDAVRYALFMNHGEQGTGGKFYSSDSQTFTGGLMNEQF